MASAGDAQSRPCGFAVAEGDPMARPCSFAVARAT